MRPSQGLDASSILATRTKNRDFIVRVRKQTSLLSARIERLFLIEDGKAPATVGRDSRYPHKVAIFFVFMI